MGYFIEAKHDTFDLNTPEHVFKYPFYIHLFPLSMLQGTFI